MVRRVPVTISYSALVAAVTAVTGLLSPAQRSQLAREASTDLRQLRRRPVQVLAASAFVLERPWHIVALPPLAAAMAQLERRSGSAATAAVFAAGHVGATLAVAGGVAAGTPRGWLDPRWREVVDVGISYGGLAIAGAWARGLRPDRRRTMAVGISLGLGAVAATRREPVDAGHLLAWGIGLLVSSAAPGGGRSPGR